MTGSRTTARTGERVAPKNEAERGRWEIALLLVVTPVLQISTSVGTFQAEPCLEHSQQLKQCSAKVLECLKNTEYAEHVAHTYNSQSLGRKGRRVICDKIEILGPACQKKKQRGASRKKGGRKGERKEFRSKCMAYAANQQPYIFPLWC